MGIEKPGRSRQPLDTEKNSERSNKQVGKLAQALVLGGALLGSAQAAEAQQYAPDQLAKTSEYQSTLDTRTTLLKLAADKNTLPVEQFTAERRQLPDKLIFTVALLAHNVEPKYADFENDPALAEVDKVGPGLVLPLVHRKKVEAGYWHDLSQEMHTSNGESRARQEVVQTADVRIDILKDLSNKYGGVEPVELSESVAYVARNLHFNREEPTVENVQAEVRSILERRAALAQEDLFDRDVMVVSADEMWTEKTGTLKVIGTPRFNSNGLKDAIKERMRTSGDLPKNFLDVSPLVQDAMGYHSTPETIARAKTQTLGTISSATKPLTVYFRGHGGLGYFDLSTKSGDASKDYISVEELADALTARWHAEQSKYRNASELHISLVFDDCEMQAYVRSLSETLASRGVPLPGVMITASEWDQFSFSRVDELGSSLGGLLVHNPDLGSVMQNKHQMKDSDPSIFTPRKEDRAELMQVSGIVVPPDSAAA